MVLALYIVAVAIGAVAILLFVELCLFLQLVAAIYRIAQSLGITRRI